MSRGLRASTVLLFFRSRGLRALGIAVAAMLLVTAFAPTGLSMSPFASIQSVYTLANSALVAGVLWSAFVASPWPVLEASVSRRRLAGLRAAWLLFGATALVGGGALVLAARGMDVWHVLVLVRNALFAVGVGTLSGCLLPRAVAWLPLLVLGMASWILGTTDSSATARWWALPNYPLESPAMWIATGSVVLAGAVVYVVHDGSP